MGSSSTEEKTRQSSELKEATLRAGRRSSLAGGGRKTRYSLSAKAGETSPDGKKKVGESASESKAQLKLYVNSPSLRAPRRSRSETPSEDASGGVEEKVRALDAIPEGEEVTPSRRSARSASHRASQRLDKILTPAKRPSSSK